MVIMSFKAQTTIIKTIMKVIKNDVKIQSISTSTSKGYSRNLCITMGKVEHLKSKVG